MRKATTNINASLYGGEFTANYECGGRCALAAFYIDPPSADDDCIFLRSGDCCAHPHACREALEALREAITQELAQLSIDGR